MKFNQPTNHANDGRSFEDIVERINLQYQRKGMMRLKKVDPPTRVFKGTVIFLENPFLDYAGVMTMERGRAVFIEAKSTSVARLAIGGRGGVSDKQIGALDAWEECGAIVGVLWGYQDEMRFVSRKMIHAVLQSENASLKWSEAEPIARGKGFIIYDYIENLRRHARTFRDVIPADVEGRATGLHKGAITGA